MSITLKNKKDSICRNLKTESQFVNASIIKALFSNQLKTNIHEIQLFHFGTNRQYGEHQVVKQGEQIEYQIKNIPQESTQIRKRGIVYPEELQKIIQNSKIIIIKSANQQNIQKSKDLSLWATTFSNQERLKYFFNHFKHVLLIFATNRSYEIKGLARMESEPNKIIDKSIWTGVANIRLGGNFKIKWIRKKPLSLANVEKVLGTNFKQTIIKSCDGQQLDPQVCKKLAFLLDIPEEPYYQLQDKKLIPKQSLTQRRPINYQGKNLNQSCPPLFLIQSLSNIYQAPSSKQIKVCDNSDKFSLSKQSSQKNKKNKKDKKKKKDKRKHKKVKKSDKKNKKKYSISSESSSNSSISEISVYSSSQLKREKKTKKTKRNQK